MRIVLVAYSMLQSFRVYRFMQDVTYIDKEFDVLHTPGFFIKFLHLPFPLPQGYAFSFAILYYAIALCALVGIFTRPALLIFGILTIYISDILSSRGFFDHEASLATQVILILAVAPGSTSFSLWNVIKWFYKKIKHKKAQLFDALIGPSVPVWGVKLIIIILACTYFTAGLSKIRYGGWKWLDGQTLTHYLDGSASPYTPGDKPMYISPPNVSEKEKWKDGFGVYSYSYGNRQRSDFWRELGYRIASNKYLISGVSVLTVIFELSGFILLLGGWPRILYLLGAILMHKSIGVLMNLPFVNYQIICFFLIDWKWVYNHSSAGIKRRFDPLLLNFKTFVNKI
ncbi:hypothetical protein [Agriterribacter sp.]|uniref:hypothetical protein n=1 Tax=Agriterribacter sp. TaxID=2821509 RepID=UPI002CFE671A|nr:hypothetical protein [Agriterribacter sp.]HRP54467.1 hypothetical protein [Agriterribacter sp.]